MTVPFQNIPSNIRVPLFYAEVDNSRANSAQAVQRSLLIAQVIGAVSGPVTAPTNPRFGYAPDLTSASGALLDDLFNSMVFLTGSVSGGRTGTFQTTATPGQYIWIAVLASAVGAGVSFFDGTGTGGFSGAGSTGPYGGSEVNPSTINVPYTDAEGNVWALFRSNGPSFNWNGANVFTLNFGVAESPSGSGGSGTVGVPTLVAGDGKAQGGSRSMLAQMVAAYRANDPFGELWCLPLADPAGARATGAISLAGAASAGGVLTLYVAGRRYAISVAAGQSAAVVGTALAAAINADGDAFVTASGTSTVTLTSIHTGAAANDIDVRLNYRGVAGGEVTPPGLTVTASAMTGGTLTPNLAGALANLNTQSFDFIVCPYSDTVSLDALKSLLSDSTGRWSYTQQLYGHVFTAARGTVAGLVALGSARNHQHETVMGFNQSPTPAWQWAAAMAGASAVSLRNDPGVPLQTLALAGVLPPPVQHRFAFGDRNTLLYRGISTFSVADDGTVALENVITTYQTNSFGAADNSYLQVETLFTLATVLRSLQSVVTSKFARVKLAANGTRFAAGSAIVTPNVIRGELIAQYRDLEFRGLVQNADAFKAGLIVEQSATNPNRVDVLWPGTLIGQLRIFALLAQFRLV